MQEIFFPYHIIYHGFKLFSPVSIAYICYHKKFDEMMRFLSILCSIVFLSAAASYAQDYSNQGLIHIKEQSEEGRLDWDKAFDAAVASNNFSALAAIRQANEKYLDDHLSGMRRLYAEGDGRALLSAVNNYLQIERQFVKDVMIPAESLKPNDKDGVAGIYQKITEYSQKEKMFVIDISNAIQTLPPPSAESPATLDSEMNIDNEDARGSIIEDRSDKQDKKSKKKDDDDDDDDGE